MKVWVTKYALTTGIKEFAVESEDKYGYGEVVVHNPEDLNGHSIFNANNWHKTREEALAKAEKMRVTRIASLKKQIAKLENMKFEIENDDR